MLVRIGRVGIAVLALFIVSLVWTASHRQQPPAHAPSVSQDDEAAQRVSLYQADEGELKHYYSAAHSAIAPPVRGDRLSASAPTPSAASKPSSNAYVFYVSNDAYACSVLVNVYRLQSLFHTQHRIFVLASAGVSAAYIATLEAANATVSVQQVPEPHPESASYYHDCLLKLVSFRMHYIDPSLKRVLVLDSDQLIVRELDHVFELPVVDLAAPRAYWIAKDMFASTFMLINLSDRLWGQVEAVLQNIGKDKYDMDVLNDLFQDTVMMLPGSYATLNSHWEDWNLPKWFMPEVAAKNGNGTSAAETSGNSGPPEVEEDIGTANEVVSRRDASKPADMDVSDEAEPEETETEVDAIGITDSKSLKDKIPFDGIEYVYKVPERNLIDPATHPLREPLFALYASVHVLHYSALGKPWAYPLEFVRSLRPAAHPVFLEQWTTWREAALDLCPPVQRTIGDGLPFESKIVQQI